jgi:hypothetical protein
MVKTIPTAYFSPLTSILSPLGGEEVTGIMSQAFI